MPLVRPVTIIGLDAPDFVIDPGVDVTVYPVIALPFAPAPENVTVAWVLPPTAVTVVGAVGRPAGVTALDALEAMAYSVEWHDYLMKHSLCIEEIHHISAFINTVFSQA